MLLKKRRYALGFFLSLTLGIGLLMGSTASATETEGSTETEVELTAVDTGKGITYIYDETEETILGINLNGNSVIVVESENSTDEKRLNNIYIDKDRDGIIDEDETIVKVGDSTDVSANIDIYGVYQQKTTTPVAVTIQSGKVPNVYVVYQGELNVTGETGVSVKLYGGIVTNTFYGAYESKLTVDGARAIDILVDTDATTSIYQIKGAYKSAVELKNAAVSGIHLAYKNGVVNNTYVLSESSYILTNCTDTAVKYDVTQGNYDFTELLYSGVISSDGANPILVDIDITGGIFGMFYGSYNTNLNSGKNTNTAMDVDVTDSAIVTSYFYGIYGGTTTAKCPVVGNVDVNYNPTAIPSSGYNIGN